MTTTATELAPGIHRGIPFADYCIDPGVNASTLKLFTGRTPKHAKHDLDQPEDDSKSLAIGHASHTAVLEPDLFDDLYAVYPKQQYIDDYGHPNSNKYKAARDDWYEEHEHAAIITDDEYEHAMRIAEAVRTHPLASKLLIHNRGASEMTVIGELEVNGYKIRTKARIDRVTEYEHFPAIPDLKTISTKGGRLDELAAKRAIKKYKYHQQGAWYLDRLHDHRPADRLFIPVFVENAPPYDVICGELQRESAEDYFESIESGREANEKALSQLVVGLKEGRWPGYSRKLLAF
jgi:hypothetical protein